MRRIILSAMLLLPAAGVAQAQIPTDCSRVLQISNWKSEFSRGYYSNTVDLKNIGPDRVTVSHRYNGAGAIYSPPIQLAPDRFTRREVARTQNRLSPTELQAATTLTCTRP